jgi:hypothetical protein
MRILMAAVTASALLVGGCGDEAPVKRQPGSWSQKVEIVRLDGKSNPPEARAQMQKMFDMMSSMSICLTPEAAAKEDVAKEMGKMSSGGSKCTFDKQDLTGQTVALSGTCEAPKGRSLKIQMNGSSTATAQDVTMKMERFTAGASEGVMEMRVRSSRTGDCKPGDVTPPAKGAGQ